MHLSNSQPLLRIIPLTPSGEAIPLSLIWLLRLDLWPLSGEAVHLSPTMATAAGPSTSWEEAIPLSPNIVTAAGPLTPVRRGYSLGPMGTAAGPLTPVRRGYSLGPMGTAAGPLTPVRRGYSLGPMGTAAGPLTPVRRGYSLGPMGTAAGPLTPVRRGYSLGPMGTADGPLTRRERLFPCSLRLDLGQLCPANISLPVARVLVGWVSASYSIHTFPHLHHTRHSMQPVRSQADVLWYVRAATLRQKLWTKLAISPNHSTSDDSPPIQWFLYEATRGVVVSMSAFLPCHQC